MCEPVDGDEDESAIEISIGTESISAERASLVKTPIDDEPIVSIRRDNTWERTVEPNEMTSGNR